MIKKLLLYITSSSSFLFSQKIYEYDGTEVAESGIVYFILGYNNFTPNYDKVHFMFTDSIQGILLFDSIEFKRMNNTFRFGLNPQFNLKNNFLLDFGMSFTMPLFKHIQMNQFSAGIGYNIKIHENFHIKPLVVLEKNKYYYALKTFKGDIGQSLIIEGRNMGNDVNIRYIQTSVGISPKVSFCFRPLNKKSTDAIEFALDFGYHFSFAKKERMQFRYENNSSGNIINDLIIVAFRNISEKKVPVNNYLYSNGNRVDKKIISPDNLFFAFKIGYTF